jgi:hypothetical protein
MGGIFGDIYCFFFEDFFGLDLANYLWGGTDGNPDTNLFIGFGIGMLCVSLLLAIIYYYVLNHPKFAKWWGWTIVLGINAVINFIVGWHFTLSDFYDGKMDSLDVGEGNCFNFGITNAILSIVAFFIISMIIKWKSSNCAHCPF